jgi:hypothetical protein
MAKASDRGIEIIAPTPSGRAKASDRGVGLSSLQTHPTTGVVTVTGKLTRPGLLPYAADEHPSRRETIVFRSPAAVFDQRYLNSIKGSLISPDHSFLDQTDKHGGLVTGAVARDGFVFVELMFTNRPALDRVMNGARQISAGYTYDYDIMSGSEIARAKTEYPEDWKQIQTQLRSPDRALWVSASNLLNNHVAPVVRGRAGKACSLDEAMTMDDETLGQTVITEGVLPAVDEIPCDTSLNEMIEEILNTVLKLQSSMSSAGIAFDGAAFASDRAGYLEGLLTTVGVSAKDASLSMATDLVVAYATGYKAGLAIPATVSATTPATSEATDKGLPESVTIAPADPSLGGSSEPAVLGNLPKKAWDKFTRPISA